MKNGAENLKESGQGCMGGLGREKWCNYTTFSSKHPNSLGPWLCLQVGLILWIALQFSPGSPFSLPLPFLFLPQPSKWISVLLIASLSGKKKKKTTTFFLDSHTAINSEVICGLKRCEDPSLPESKQLGSSRTGVSLCCILSVLRGWGPTPQA